MATDALSIPFDITWQRLAWSTDMLDRSFAGGLPPKWRSSLAVYAYVVPLEDTAEDYPDTRIVYLKLSASITGWSPRETIEGHLLPDPSWDAWQRAAWEAIAASPTLTRSYWPCVTAIAQVGVYPRPETGVADDDYPYIVDFEPKKRELYEAVTETGEVLSASSGNTNVRKGGTTTSSHELGVSARATIKVPVFGGVDTAVTDTHRWGSEEVDITTTDASTERRETAGRSTSLSQMYQLFNGYHVGSNRAVFAIFPRPHTVTDADQADNNLVNGERRLEGVQDIFLVVSVPVSVPGICVRAFLDTGHKGYPENGLPPQLVVTRRNIGGCGEFAGDRLNKVPAPLAPLALPDIVGEYQVGGWRDEHRIHVGTDKAGRVAVANELNFAGADARAAVLGAASAGGYATRRFVDSDAFWRVASVALRSTTIGLDDLVTLGYLSAADVAQLGMLGIKSSGDLFSEPRAGEWPSIVATARAQVIAGIKTTIPSV